jgi:SDR family mycofactocin-dependent oxidoreductase
MSEPSSTAPPLPRPVALVTGAARGIGAATVARLLAEGWSVVATDACADDAALGYPLATRAELDAVAKAGDGHCVAAVADVRSQADLDAAVDLALARFGALDAAVAAAGVLAGGAPAWATPEEQWAVQLDVNLTGVWRLANAAVPALLDRPGPRPGHAAFVAISSAAGVRGLPQLAAYSASKHGVVGLVTSMAAELGPFDVTANVICPGSTRTPILEASAQVYGLASSEEFARHHLLPRLLEPDEIAAAVAFLCGPAGSAITGAVLPVDAGMGAT